MVETTTLKKETQGFLVFGGTSEGRKLAEFLSGKGIPATLCVATEYGQEVLSDGLSGIRVRTGRLHEAEMEALMRECRPLAVVDATHPYAEEVTENIRLACENAECAYYRLLRRETPLEAFDNLRVFGDCAAAADWLEGQTGNLLLTTGMKELPEFAARLTDKSRIYARVLLQEDVPAQTEQLGLAKKQVICMQGPFSREMNVATLHMTDAAFLVTKESGENGGFAEKAEAAAEAGATCVVIRRPGKETGNSFDEICAILSRLWENGSSPVAEPEQEGSVVTEASDAPSKQITLVGIGVGGFGQLTMDAMAAYVHTDCVIGAPRMLNVWGHHSEPNEQRLGEMPDDSDLQKMSERNRTPVVPLYKADEIVAFIRNHPEYEKIIVLFSGDIGFYSGAKPLLEKLAQTPELDAYRVKTVCGISSVAYFASKLHMPWEDMALVSMHGREQNLVNAVRTNARVFTLADNAASIRAIAEKLDGFGFGGIRMYVGADLSYPTERIDEGIVRDFLQYGMDNAENPEKMSGESGSEDGPDFKNENRAERELCVAVFENPCAGEQICTYGIPDSAFVRGKVPMTKEEVRSISVSKLRLTRDAVVYDIGSGTGSVAVECARMADRGKVYAIEWKEDAWKLIAENRKRFAVSNLEIVAGRAPKALKELPAPTHALIGGSDGEMKRILKALYKKNPGIRVVVNGITLETLTETLDAAPKLGFVIDDLVSVGIAKSQNVGDYHMMTGQNPVYVITLTGGKTEESQGKTYEPCGNGKWR